MPFITITILAALLKFKSRIKANKLIWIPDFNLECFGLETCGMNENTRQYSESSQSLLEAIRQKELEVTRQLAAAQDNASRELIAAKEEAQFIINQAVERGRMEGEAARKKRFEEIEQEAAVIIAAAKKQAEQIHQVNDNMLAMTVVQVIDIVAGSIQQGSRSDLV